VDLSLAGKVVVVTGGGSNIGRAIATGFALEGARVVIADKDAEQAVKVADEIGDLDGYAIARTLDVTDAEACQAFAQEIETTVGSIEVLVNNVGWNGHQEFFLGLGPERWEKSFRLNLFSAFSMTQAVLPAMVERRGGSLIHISSDAAFGDYRVADYGSMKAGLLTFSRSIALEYGRYGIRSNAITPGAIVPEADAIGAGSYWNVDTGLGPEQLDNIISRAPLRRASAAEDVAWSALFLASDKARQLTGQVLSVSGGFAMPR
jgi:2-hydroxycyclohexanecarboxyl-CoA dehydrogenase